MQYNHINIVTANGPSSPVSGGNHTDGDNNDDGSSTPSIVVSSGNHTDGDDNDDGSSIPGIAIGIVAGIAIIVVIGVILATFYLRYIHIIFIVSTYIYMFKQNVAITDICMLCMCMHTYAYTYHMFQSIHTYIHYTH